MPDSNQLAKEYEVCFSNWRFFVGLRFTVLAYFLTLNSGLLYVFVSHNNSNNPFVFVIPVLGLISIIAGCMIENRNRRMYYVNLQRAKEIERRFNYVNNDAKKIESLGFKEEVPRISKEDKGDDKPKAEDNCIAILLDHCCPITPYSSQTWGIRIIYGVFFVVWISLFMSLIY